MTILNALLLITTINICFAGSLVKSDIYISPKGNDKNSGTKGNPVKSIQKAQELVQSKTGKKEVQVIFADGIYYLPNPIVLTADFSGSEKFPVVFRAENEGKAIISGGNQIELKWEPFKNGIFKAVVTEDATLTSFM